VNEQDRVAYVRATLVMQGYQFSELRVIEIAREFERIESIAATIVNAELARDLEAAPMFRP
jgi:1-carboxybiuret hydrolase subunit AtzG-like protein